MLAQFSTQYQFPDLLKGFITLSRRPDAAQQVKLNL